MPQPITTKDLSSVGAAGQADPARVGSAVMAAQQAGSSLPSLDQSSSVIQPGAIQNAAVNNSRRYTDTIDQLLSRQSFSETEEGRAAAEDVKLKEAKITAAESGQFGAEDAASIAAAGEAAKSAYTQPLSDAELAKRKGLASGLVEAAKSGGLDSSAWVGISALVGEPAGGPEGFLGVGGKLASMASEYDQQIANLKVAQNQAFTAAQDAKKQAIISNKKDDWDRAIKLYDVANQAYRDGTDMLANRTAVLDSYQTHLEKTTLEAQQNATTNVQTWASSGISADKISAQDKSDMEISLKLPTGTFDQFYKTLLASAKAKTTGDNLDFEKKALDLAKSLSPGQKVTIPMPDGTTTTIAGIGEGKLLSILDAERLGVPYGTTEDEAAAMKKKITPKAPSDGKLTPEEKDFKSEMGAEQKKLSRGGSWGDSWNHLMNRYGEELTAFAEANGYPGPNEVLDAVLNKDRYYTQ